jgi:IS605 OrfB family transposase
MNMQRTLKLKFFVQPEVRDSLISTIEQFNRAANYCAEWGYKNHTRSKRRVHDAAYYEVREKYGLPASLATGARDMACEALRAVKLKKLPEFGLYGAIRYNRRVLTVKLTRGTASIAIINGRVKASFFLPEYYRQYLDWEIKSSTLSYRKGTFFLHVTVEKEAPPRIEGEVLGIDRGIVNIAVLSNNIFFNSRAIKNIRARYACLRKKLQSKGTRSAKRKLKKLAGREKRFVTDVNHCIAKEIARMPYAVFALENLRSVRVQKRRGKKFNRKLNNWAFYQFEQFLRYKAEAQGKQVILVDSRYSSQKCSRCGHTYKGNRNGPNFRCRRCGFQLHADLNAARNITQAGRACLGRLTVNQPIVAGNEEHLSDLSYKPRPFREG